MTEKYKITATYDWAPTEPNLFVFDREGTLDYLTRLNIPHDPDHLADGGERRVEPEPDGLVIKWESYDDSGEHHTEGRGEHDG